MGNVNSMPASMETLVERAERAILAMKLGASTSIPLPVLRRPAESVPVQVPSLAPTQVVGLQRWPDLARQPASLLPLMTRVCALLARRRTGVHMIGNVLKADHREVEQILALLQSARCLSLGGDMQTTAGELAAADSWEHSVQHHGWRRLWRRLAQMDH